MKIYRYALPWRLSKKPREGLLLHDEATDRWGEVAPLPGWSQETLEEVLELPAHSPSVSFGVESLSLEERRARLPVCGLLLGTFQEMMRRGEELLALGFTHLKIKIAALSPQEAFEILSFFKDKARLRVDLNKKLSLREALAFFSAFSAEDFDYVEDPLKNSQELSSFPFPLAVDQGDVIPATSYLKAIVYKPTLRGGLSHCKKVLEKGIPLVLSSAFESGVGITQIALMAAHLGLSAPLGIDTYSYLHADLLKEPLSFKNGFFELPSKLAVNKELLHAL